MSRRHRMRHQFGRSRRIRLRVAMEEEVESDDDVEDLIAEVDSFFN